MATRTSGYQRDAEHGAREAGEGGRGDEPKSRDGQRRRLFVPADREEGQWHAGPEGLRQRRPGRTADQAEYDSAAQVEDLQGELAQAEAAVEAAGRHATSHRGLPAAVPRQAAIRLRLAAVREALPGPPIWNDGQFTYIKADAKELPAVYEVKDGKPALLNFQVHEDTYVVPKVLERGYLALGKERFPFVQQGR